MNDLFYIDAGCLPGLLDGWCGPCERLFPFTDEPQKGAWWDSIFIFGDSENGGGSENIRLDLRREEVWSRVAKVIGQNLKREPDGLAPPIDGAWVEVEYSDSEVGPGVPVGVSTVTIHHGGVSYQITSDECEALDDIDPTRPTVEQEALAAVARWAGKVVR